MNFAEFYNNVIVEGKANPIDEINVTSNMDGGEGPAKTPHAFKKSKGVNPEDEPDHDSIEVFDFKKDTADKEKHFESLYAKLASRIHINSENV